MKLTRGSPPVAFGLDISDDSFKIVQLRAMKGGRASVEIMLSSALPKGSVANGEIVDGKAVTKALRSTLEPFRYLHARGVVASLPEPITFTQTISIPKTAEASTPASFRTRLEEVLPEYVPFPLSETYFDGTVVREDAASWVAVVGAVAKKLADPYLATLESAGLIPLALDVEAAAVANALIPSGSSDARAIINLGRRRSSLFIHDQGVLQFTMSLPIAGETITKKICDDLSLTADQAEKTKRVCGLDSQKCEGALRTILEGMVQDLVHRIDEGRKYYRDRFPDSRDITEVIFTGGGAHLIGLDTVLANMLNIPVRRGKLWENVTPERIVETEDELRYAVAVGLALRALNGTNLL